MLLSEFDFNLPEELIAQVPLPNREDSRLMVLDRRSKTIQHDYFLNIFTYLKNRPLMVFNDTRVIPARLVGVDKNKKDHEMLLVDKKEGSVWRVLVRGMKKLKKGDIFKINETLKAVFMGRQDDHAVFRFESTGEAETDDLIRELGKPPLPPYIQREAIDKAQESSDRERYQTLYAKKPGAIAAPTAGLHFSKEVLAELPLYAEQAFITLHVGLGTFEPVRVENIEEHRVRKEFFSINSTDWNKIRNVKLDKKKVVAVGTTTTRTLESLCFGQSRDSDFSGDTELFIYPGSNFKNVDAMVTNFHLPKSSLYLLVSAFAGSEFLRQAYLEAIREKYRFYSYGDAMLIV